LAKTLHSLRRLGLRGLACLALAIGLGGCGSEDGPAGSPADGESQTLRIGVGPLLPTPEDTTKA